MTETATHAETERPAATAPAVETFGLRKVYGERVAVEDLTLRVEEGEVFGFLGPNGAGKTTSVKMLMGLVRPTSGTARLLGRPLGDRAARAKIGFLPEMFRFHDWLTGEELLDIHGQLYGMSRAQRQRRIPEVLELVGLSHAARQRVRTYSKGMQQRIGLAQALLNEPRLVFLDEPTSALDPIGRRDVRDIILRLRAAGMTVFLNSHLLSEVESVSDRVAIINHGRVAAIGPMADLLRRDLTVELRLSAVDPELLDDLGRLVHIEHVDGRERPTVVARVPDEETIARAVDLLVGRGVRVYGVTPERRTLEQVFLDVVEKEGGEVR
ncbi:ABC transporter ATP-binding protein [Sphaerobacter thermophilus]|uniref:ABC transporter related protein n=1 Tax=Sphaerobacter thermophilus (strain ATCC 49802 / DSM 20745 / KCCM 41009 / NCIMB 13125 / S 6022) TaxID=479434 RepID=D1C6J0_SPHTD|nr:ABC transporter ATP-binding protein [Sphaerobacter thermophilus]ACZ39615.1 ABC transporter related protein [Sphaerobacter thermophilus DSM 20745]